MRAAHFNRSVAAENPGCQSAECAPHTPQCAPHTSRLTLTHTSIDLLRMPKKTTSKEALVKKAAARAGSKKGPKKRSGSLIQRTVANAIAAHKTRGEEALSTITRNRQQIADSFFDIGLELAVLRRVEVWSAMGHASFDEVIPSTGLSRSTAFSLLSITARFTRSTAIVLGPERSRSLIRYTDATAEEDDPETLAREDAEINGTPISQLTAEQIEQAARDARPVSRGPKREGEKEARAVVQALHKRITKAGGEAELKRVKGAWVAVVTVPIEKAGTLKV